MKRILAPLAAAVAMLAAVAAIVTNVGTVRQVEADRRAVAESRAQDSREDRLSSTEAAVASQPQAAPQAKDERVLKYEVATSAPRRSDGSVEKPLERVEARPPLSRIGQALPPKPPAPGEWKPTTLFQPVATAAGLIEAKGYSIAIAGIEAVKPDETCEGTGKSWPCGALAKAAFRAFLRGRAVSCIVPPQPEQTMLAAQCAVGKTDVATWLVVNGWARAATDGPLSKQADEAKTVRRGIYGSAPNFTAPSVAMTASGMPAPAGADAVILDNTATDVTAPTPVAPIVDAPFPPAPAPFTPPAAPQAPAQ